MFKLDIFKTLHICTEHGKSFMHGTIDPVYQICSFKDGDILGQDYDRIRDQGSGAGGGDLKNATEKEPVVHYLYSSYFL